MANHLFQLPGGICLNSAQKGLLCLEDERLKNLINTRPITDFYDVEHAPFARGKFASVKKCIHKETGIAYAAKFIRKRRRLMDHRQDILHEVAILQMSSECSGIVNLHEVYETKLEMVLVLELAAGGELQRIVDAREGLGEAETKEILRQILRGLEFLHGRNVAHLDIKPQNILLTGEYPGAEIKLCDFGISRVIQNGVDVREILGTPDYVAPEILSYEPISLETDIWSVGVLAYVLLTGYSPFGGETKQETFCNISQCNLTFPEEFFDGLSSNAQDFITQTLVTKPSNRLNVSQCLSHPWLNGVPSYIVCEPNKILGNATSYPVACLTCSQCKSVSHCCHRNGGSEESENGNKSQEMMKRLKSHVDIMLDRSILC
ncbi:UNVERIFIED_CONTAM: hypothetical protein PYX00_010497 [Menopon gallinae]|uniref:non-specific serine/threonine protein kinase n=1 Tax=Menopon gallinae TaxID=328185 RepID=A0AAW2HFY0_9NEOP